MKTCALVLLVVLGGATAAAAEVVSASGGHLRMLDKMTGVVSDHDLARGQSQALGRLTVTLDDCRYPSDLPTGEAYAHLTITDPAAEAPLFQGWMVATSPALSALDHQRYDVWVLQCDVPEPSG
jgi:hypothetical protein